MRHDDPAIVKARNLLNEWVREINQEAMLSTEREYVRGLVLRHLESQIVAEVLIDLLAKEFTKPDG